MVAVLEWLTRCRESRKLILIIVAIALLLDNMLLTTVVPIIPKYLYQLEHPNYDEEFASAFGPRLPAKPKTPTQFIVNTEEPQRQFRVKPRTRSPPRPPTLPPCNRYPYPFYITTQAADYEEQSLGTEEVGERDYVEMEDGQKEIAADYNEDQYGLLTTESPEDALNRTRYSVRKALVQETVQVGIMFSSKAFVQLITNPFIGPLTHRIGYSIPMFAGFIIMFLSTLIFAFGTTYSILFIARALQGVGSSCSSVSGMGMLAERYPDDKERGNAMGIALGGLALGVLIGPPFGGVMFQFVGKTAPFLILAVLALGDGRAITFANMGIGMLEPSLPLWMMSTMGSPEWQLGAAFLPASISYLIGTNLFGPLGHMIGRWLASLIGLVIIGICLLCIPMATHFNHLIGPNAGLGFAIGMVDSSMMPELGYLVDLRHSAVYGSVYSIGDVAFCLGFAIGPALSGTLVNAVGFEWMLYGISIINFAYAPLMYFLKSPPSKAEEQRGLIYGQKTSVKYTTYRNEEEED